MGRTRVPVTPPRKNTLNRRPTEPEQSAVVWVTPDRGKIRNRPLNPKIKHLPSRSPVKQRFGRIGIRFIPLIRDTMRDIVKDEERGNVSYKADPFALINRLFPSATLPMSVDDAYNALVDAKHIVPGNIRPLIFYPLWITGAHTKGKDSEVQLAEYLQKIMGIIYAGLGDRKLLYIRRNWTGKFSSTAPAAYQNNILRKPDLLALRPTVKGFKKLLSKEDRLPWVFVDISGEVKTYNVTDEAFVNEIVPEISQKIFCKRESQEDRRFVPFPTFTNNVVRVSHYDCGGTIHTSGIDVQTETKLFLHLMMGLTFGSAEQIGFDTTIKTSSSNRSRTMMVKSVTYHITGTLFWSCVLQGRATGCWAVEHGQNSYAVKKSWVEPDRIPSEVDLLIIANNIGVAGIPRLVAWEDVKINGVVDSCENIRGRWPACINRVHRRLVFENYGVPIWFFRTVDELLGAVIDHLNAHNDLFVDAGILHRDISLMNLMLAAGDYPRNGLLVDLGYAKLFTVPKIKDVLEDKENRPTRQMPPRKVKKLNPPEVPQNAAPKKGFRTGTYAFISHEILLNPSITHTDVHDRHSFFYVLLFICVMFTGPCDQQLPTDFPWFICDWIKCVDDTRLGHHKNGMITGSDQHFEESFLSFVTPYFECLKPLLRALRKAIVRKRLTHNVFVAELHKARKRLVPEKPAPMPNRKVVESPIKRVDDYLGAAFVNNDLLDDPRRVHAVGRDVHTLQGAVNSAPGAVESGASGLADLMEALSVSVAAFNARTSKDDSFMQ